MKPRTCAFSTKRELTKAMVDLLSRTFTHDYPAPFGVMLSGGSTPIDIYNEVGACTPATHPNLRLFLSDDRFVPFNHPSSNTRMLRTMLNQMNVPQEHFIAIEPSLEINKSAQAYHDALENEFSNNMTIELGILGLGTDGHTAGIFNNTLATSKSATYTAAVDRPDQLQGITTTRSLLLRVKKIIFLVVGETKIDILRTLLNDPLSIPAGNALQGHPNVEIWTDQSI